jgi:hypothetical protein
MPGKVGTVAGLFFGFAFGMGGLGLLADQPASSQSSNLARGYRPWPTLFCCRPRRPADEARVRARKLQQDQVPPRSTAATSRANYPAFVAGIYPPMAARFRHDPLNAAGTKVVNARLVPLLVGQTHRAGQAPASGGDRESVRSPRRSTDR